ncbi:MAG: hypothetical protein KZQ83_18195 [gamma proteobacterium symbiont of Taylorina sp.]|nr:hypothetical protein [gamma proteobacterium symbiont of Taylorina sp.]
MKATILIIHNLVIQAKVSDEIIELISEVRYDLEEVFDEISKDKIIVSIQCD